MKSIWNVWGIFCICSCFIFCHAWNTNNVFAQFYLSEWVNSCRPCYNCRNATKVLKGVYCTLQKNKFLAPCHPSVLLLFLCWCEQKCYSLNGGVFLLLCAIFTIWHWHYVVSRCPADAGMCLVVELQTVDVGGSASLESCAWAKLFLFSGARLLTGRWHVPFRQLPFEDSDAANTESESYQVHTVQ